MSADRVRQIVIGLFLVVVLGAAAWFFNKHFEASWDAQPETSDAASHNTMLAAERLLQKHGYHVQVDQTLSIALFQPLPEGTLLLAEGGDHMLLAQSQALLSWVERGNTLVVSPRRSFYYGGDSEFDTPVKPAQGKAAQPTSESISSRFGVALVSPTLPGTACRVPGREEKPKPIVNFTVGKNNPKITFVECVATLNLPSLPHALRLDASEARLVATAEAEREDECGCKKKSAGKKGADAAKKTQETDEDDEDEAAPSNPVPDSSDTEPAKDEAGSDAKPAADSNDPFKAQPGFIDNQPGLALPVLADGDAKAVRVFAHGKGRVVILAEQYFGNYELGAYDHGELLLGLAALNTHGKNITVIQRVDIASWIKILWHVAPYAICTLAAFLLLWAWSSMRRFGPQLPDPDDRRRALLEHVDASGRWLWKTVKGREIMLAAMRRATERTLARRIPELRKLAPERQIERLAADGKLSRADLERALLDAPGRLPIEFTHQIQILQELRAHYER